MQREPASLFSLKLVLGYTIAFCFVPDVLYLVDSGSNVVLDEFWNSELLLSLILCLPLIAVMAVAVWQFRRMPYLASGCIGASLLMIADAVGTYISRGFDAQFGISLASFNWLGLLLLAVVMAIPFLVAWFVGRSKLRRQRA